MDIRAIETLEHPSLEDAVELLELASFSNHQNAITKIDRLIEELQAIREKLETFGYTDDSRGIVRKASDIHTEILLLFSHRHLQHKLQKSD